MMVVSRMLLVSAAAALMGCTTHSSTTRPSNWSEQALKDPYNFNPKMDQEDISGGDLGNYDNKAMRKDVDRVLNP